MPNQVGPFECHLEKEPGRGDRAIDAWGADMVPRSSLGAMRRRSPMPGSLGVLIGADLLNLE